MLTKHTFPCTARMEFTGVSPPNTNPSSLLLRKGINKEEEREKKISNSVLTPTLSLPQPAIAWGTPNFSELPNPIRKQPQGQIKVKFTGACTSTTRNSLQTWGSGEKKTNPYWHQPWAADSSDLALTEQCHVNQQLETSPQVPSINLAVPYKPMFAHV